jgi:hypothetical protein
MITVPLSEAISCRDDKPGGQVVQRVEVPHGPLVRQHPGEAHHPVNPDRPQRVDGVGTGDFHVSSPELASFAILEMCLSIARWFHDDGARTAGQVADEYADFALRIAGFVPDRPSPAGRAQQGPDDPNRGVHNG